MRVSLQRMDFERQIFLFPIYKLKKSWIEGFWNWREMAAEQC